MKPSGIGGQAVIEGVMMKNKERYAVAVRTEKNGIIVEKNQYQSLTEKGITSFPIIRGVVTFIDSLRIGMKTLNYSASFFEEEEESSHSAEKEKTEKDVNKEAVLMGITMTFSIIIAVALFILLPFYISNLLKNIIPAQALRGLIEGVIRISLFIGYVKAISMMKDIKRVFMYHGAEHKAINCVENGLALTVKNVKEQTKAHKRCGTSFLLVVMLISILFFLFIVADSLWIRMVLRLLLIPVIAGIAYEFIRLAGRSDSKMIEILSKPGLWLQGLTTLEPDDDMIEVAIASVEAVFDWKAFIAGEGDEKPEEVKKPEKHKKTKKVNEHKKEKVKKKKDNEEKVSEKVKKSKNENKPEKEDKPEKDIEPVNSEDVPFEEDDGIQIVSIDDKDEDEVLKALDRYFECPENEDDN